MVELHQNERFDKLCLDQRSLYYHDRLVREYRVAFRYCPYVTCEFEIQQELQEFFTEAVLASQILRIFFGEAETLHVCDDLLQSCHDGKSAAVRNASEEHIEACFRVFNVRVEVTVCHRDLIEIRQHRKIVVVKHFALLFSPRGVTSQTSVPFWPFTFTF